jgi:hypothetical protein
MRLTATMQWEWDIRIRGSQIETTPLGSGVATDMRNYEQVTTCVVISAARRPYHFFRFSSNFLYLLYRAHTKQSTYKRRGEPMEAEALLILNRGLVVTI